MAKHIPYLSPEEVNKKMEGPFDGAFSLRLTQGYYTLIDAEDFDKLSHRSWSVRRGHDIPYAWSGKNSVHRVIMSTPEHLVVDHINQNPLDNRKRNLRNVTSSQNLCNRRRPGGGRSKYRGVAKRKSCWTASIAIDGSSSMYLGSFQAEEDAAKAFDLVAASLRYEYAITNFPVTDHVAMQVVRTLYKALKFNQEQLIKTQIKYQNLKY